MTARNKIAVYYLLGIFAFVLLSSTAVKAEENIYYYNVASGFDQKQALIVWNKINSTNEAKIVTSEKSYSVVIFMHPYTVGIFDPSTAEWIVVISSIPENTKEIKISIFRLDYQTFSLKKIYKFSYPARTELSLEESIAIMEEEMKKDPYRSNNPIEREKIVLQGGNYIYSYPAGDFGGTIIVNKYARRAIFYATTVWAGTGRLIIPEAELNMTPSNTSEYETPIITQTLETPVLTQTTQVTPKVSGFEVVFGIMGVLAGMLGTKVKKVK